MARTLECSESFSIFELLYVICIVGLFLFIILFCKPFFLSIFEDKRGRIYLFALVVISFSSATL